MIPRCSGDGLAMKREEDTDALAQRGEDARMSKKILDLARDQQEEIAREGGGNDDEWEDDEDETRGEP